MLALAIMSLYNFTVNYTIQNKLCQMYNIIENINPKDINSKLVELQIENRSYSDQLNRQSDQFIYYSTALFFILGLFGITIFFKIIDSKIKDARASIYKSYQEQSKDYEIHKKEFLDLKIKLYKTISNVDASLTSQYISTHPAFSFRTALNGARFINLSYDSDISDNKKDERNIFSHLDTALSILNTFKSQDDIIKFREYIKKFEKETEADFVELFNAKRIEVKSKCAEVRFVFDQLMTIDLPVV